MIRRERIPNRARALCFSGKTAGKYITRSAARACVDGDWREDKTPCIHLIAGGRTRISGKAPQRKRRALRDRNRHVRRKERIAVNLCREDPGKTCADRRS